MHIKNNVVKEVFDYDINEHGLLVIPDRIIRIELISDETKELIKEVKLPNTLKRIHAEVFSKCKNLRKINLPQSLEELDYQAFAHCHNLKEIEIPGNVKIMTNNCFFSIRN